MTNFGLILCCLKCTPWVQKTCHSVFRHWRSYGWRQSEFFWLTV